MLVYLLYKIGQALALALPVNITYKFAEFLADLQRVLSIRDRRCVYANLYEILGPGDRQIHAYVKQVYRNFAKYIIDFFRLSKVDARFIAQNVKLENLDYLTDALKKNKGAIIVTAHLGNWELAGAVTSLLGFHAAAVVLVHKNKRVNDFFQSQRRRSGMEVILAGGMMRQCYDTLQEKKVLALVGDRDFSNHGVVTTFLGKSMRIPKGPARASLRCGAPILMAFLLRERDDKFRFIFEKPIEFQPSGEREADTLNLTNMYLAVIERYIRAYPGQWYLFRKFWEPPVW